MKRYIIILICLCGVQNIGYSYFEYIYQCTLSDNLVNISLQQKNKSHNCMQVIKFLYQKENNYNQQIQTLQEYDHSENESYWSGIQATLEKNKRDTTLLKNKIVEAVLSFEKDLFIKVKKIVMYKLNYDFTLMYKKKSNYILALHDTVYEGKSIDLINTQKEYQNIVIKLMIWDGIKSAKDFTELMAYLELYKKI